MVGCVLGNNYFWEDNCDSSDVRVKLEEYLLNYSDLKVCLYILGFSF